MYQFRYRLKKRSLRRAREEFATARYAAATTHHTTQASKQPYSFAHGRCGLLAVVCSTRLAELGVAAAAAGVDGTAAPTISLLSASDDMAARQIAVREAARHAFAGYVPRCPQCAGSARVPHVQFYSAASAATVHMRSATTRWLPFPLRQPKMWLAWGSRSLTR